MRPGLPQNVILLISTSQVARITGMSLGIWLINLDITTSGTIFIFS
jgi:hypothetical protein